MGALGAVLMGLLAGRTSIEYVCQSIAYLPLLGGSWPLCCRNADTRNVTAVVGLATPVASPAHGAIDVGPICTKKVFCALK